MPRGERSAQRREESPDDESKAQKRRVAKRGKDGKGKERGWGEERADKKREVEKERRKYITHCAPSTIT